MAAACRPVQSAEMVCNRNVRLVRHDTQDTLNAPRQEECVVIVIFEAKINNDATVVFVSVFVALRFGGPV